jgi:sigma-B regulation protein RsbU (phosphoserine phosphatase)
VQQGLLPAALPRYEAYQFAAFQHPARQVGGDFYDVIDLDDERTGILMADVADKGMHAALIMAVTRTLFRVTAATNRSPAAVAVAVHQGLLDVAPQQDTFVTAFYGVLHRPSGTLTYIRAAQERPLLARADGRVSALPGEGRFIGMLPELALDEAQLTLSHGDRLLLFSDGVTDAVNAAGDSYDNERLRAACARHVSLPAGRFVRAVLDDVRHWIGSAPPFDDLTLLAVEVRDPKQESLGY